MDRHPAGRTGVLHDHRGRHHHQQAVRVLASIDGGTETAYTIPAPGASGAVTVTVPNTQGGHSIKARAQSAANVDSAYAPTYTFGYGQAALTSPASSAAS